MLSYQHAFHAGNHADLLKHFVLSQVLLHMNKKEKPYTFIDTHSGNGLYSMKDERALKTGEAACGIQKLLSVDNTDFPKSLCDYLCKIKSYTDSLLYPGSPLVEMEYLRKQDKLFLSELHPAENELLRINTQNYRKQDTCQVQVKKCNGFNLLKSLTPPETKRGAVLIDPSYEELSDYDNVSDSVLHTFRKWSGGVIMVWYPLLSYRLSVIENMVERITEGVHVIFPNTEVNDFRLCVAPESEHEETELTKTKTPRLYGSGILVINTPWHLVETMEEVIPVLEKILFRNAA
ncbi:MAG: 23S rRNA (adenine(2030)-N(6))-methyltransferase RlmJ [Treponema sp.]|nr:23S rRNA (adenine(2030)-N(6))-methyltransferase RlmJ [Treponema sp.]